MQLTVNLPFNRKILAKIAFLVIAIFCSLAVCFYIGERFFFDKLFYKKSTLHGYLNRFEFAQDKPDINWLDNIFLNLREKDLRLLLSGNLPATKDPDTKTIVVIGDSYTYGVGVLPQERFSNLLAPILFNKYGIKAKIYNFSEPGNSIIDDYALYLLTLTQLKPDVIVIEIVTNDLLLNKPRYFYTQAIINELNQTCKMPLFANQTDTTISLLDYAKSEYESFSPKWRNRCYLEQIAANFGADGRVMFFGFSNGSVNFDCDWENAYPNGMVITEYASILKYSGNTVILNKSTENIHASVSDLEGHPSRNKHRIFAEEQAKYIAGRITEKDWNDIETRINLIDTIKEKSVVIYYDVRSRIKKLVFKVLGLKK